VTRPPALSGATYDAANHQLTFGGATLTYDLNGNLTGDGTTTYTWSARDQLASLSGPAPGSFVYDGLGRRQRKTINGTITDFMYDGLNPVREAVGASTVDLLTGLGIDEYFMRVDPSSTRNVLSDALGSTVALTDSGGTVQTEYSYGPFGAVTTSGMSSGNQLRYTGREDDATALYYYRARYYDPALQRFISEDPLQFAGGDVNLYGYVGNSPTNLIDPTGQLAFLPLYIVAGGVVALEVALTTLLTSGGDSSPSLTTAQTCEPPRWVVRGGLAKPQDLIEGTGPHTSIPGLTGFSVQHRPGLSVDELARGGQIPNRQISVTTTQILRQHGFNVVYPTPGRGQYHATVQTPHPLTLEQAVLLNSLFVPQANPYPYGR
jgi:RHS repeat-associated protein